METEKKQESISSKEILVAFDKTLDTHIERLLGTTQGIDGLLINSITISCLVLLASRETEIENFPYLPPDRYTYKTLEEELSGNSIEPGEDLNSHLESMIEKNYLKMEDDGRYFALKPTISMAQLLERVFPQMPGLNLIAYLGQVIDEVEAGRKDIESAKNQFNQMLEMQGVPLTQDDSKDEKPKKRFKYLKESYPPANHKVQKIAPIKPADIFSQLEKRTLTLSQEKATQSSYSDTLQGDLISDEVLDDNHNTAISKTHEQIEAGDTADEILMDESISEQDDPSGMNGQKEFWVSEEDREYQPQDIKESLELDPLTEGIDNEKDETIAEPILEIDDEDIEKKIAAFEEALGMQCPMCHIGGIKSEKTIKGKLYYHCTNKDCNFISWGKPYYIECPQCKNTFLIEATNSEGTNFLKCARAICHYWQKYPWEMDEDEQEQTLEEQTVKTIKPKRKKRKVRRRRVVRRKR